MPLLRWPATAGPLARSPATAAGQRKGFAGVGEFRGMLASAADAAQAGYGRSGRLGAIERATRADVPW
jgi:hypothetical protein